MTETAPSLMGLLAESLRDPRGATRSLMDVPLGRTDRWQALALAVLISVLLGYFVASSAPPNDYPLSVLIRERPVMALILELSLMILSVFAVYWVGTACGGTGRFEDAILVVAWLEFLIACLQAVQIAAMLTVPSLQGIVVLLSYGLATWLITNFIAELHGFKSLLSVFVMILVTLTGAVLGLTILLSLIGISVGA